MLSTHSFLLSDGEDQRSSLISNIDVNLNQHARAASLKVGLEGSLFKIRSKLKELWGILASAGHL